MENTAVTNLALYNALVIWIFSIISLIAGTRILKTQKRNKEALSFGWFWAMVAYFCYFDEEKI